MINYLDLQDVAEDAAHPEIDNDSWIYAHRLAQEFDYTVPDDGPGPVPDATRDAVVAALTKAAADYGVLIPDYDFEEHAQELAESIGAVEDSAAWPCSHIDWKAAADALRGDYSTVEYQGSTYLYR